MYSLFLCTLYFVHYILYIIYYIILNMISTSVC